MRSVLVLTHWFPNRYEPTKCIFTKTMLDAQARQGRFRYTLISPVPFSPRVRLPLIPEKYSNYSRLDDYENSGTYEVYRPRFFKLPDPFLRPLARMTYRASVFRAIRRNRLTFDLVHSHGLDPDGDTAVRIGAHFRVPSVVHVHDSYLEEACLRNRRRMDAIMRRASMVVPVSDFQGSILKRFYRDCAEKIVTVYNGVDTAKFRLPDRAAPGAAGERRAVFVGNLIDVKGVDILIRAMRLLKGKMNLTLDIYGNGPGAKRYKDLVEREGLSDRISFRGPIDHDRLPETLARYTFLVLPSRHETFGIVLVEAMACGIPVIAARAGGTEEVLCDDEAGILVEPEAPQALADGIESAAGRNWDRRKIRTHARKYSLDSYAAKTAAVYEDVLRRSGPHREQHARS